MQTGVLPGVFQLPAWLRESLQAEAKREGTPYPRLCRDVLERFLMEREVQHGTKELSHG